MRRLAVILCVMMSLTVHADDSLRDDIACRRTADVLPLAEIENMYFSLADLSLEEQRQQMWGLSSATKAALWTYNAERYLRHHPELSLEAQEMVRRGTALINTPAWFDIQEGSIGYPAKKLALTAFKQDFENILSRDLIYQVLIRLGPEPVMAESEQSTPAGGSRRVSVQPNSFYHCSCGSGFDCGSTSSYGCYDAWCMPTPSHCGPFGDDACTGRCKATGD